MMYQVGQTFGPDVAISERALFMDGQPRWHGLFVPPQREAKAEAWLERRGVYSFHPVTYRTVKVRGVSKRTESRYLPGYVFARFPGPAIWHRIMASQFIADAIRMSSGHPAILAHDDLANIHAMRSVDQAAEEARKKAATIHRGDKVRMMSGIFEGSEVEVLSLLGGRVMIRMSLFGSEREAEVAIDTVEKINILRNATKSGMLQFE